MRRQERVGRVSNAPVPDSEACVATHRAVPSFTAFGEERVVASAPAGAGSAPPEGAAAAATARSAPELAAPSGHSVQAASWSNPSRAKRPRPEVAAPDQDTAPGAFGSGATNGVLPPHPKKRRSGKRKPAAPQHPQGPAAHQPQAAAPRSGAGRQHAQPCTLCTMWQVHRLPARALLKSRRPPYLRSTRPHCYWLDREWGDARPENKGQVHKQQVRGWWWLWAHGSCPEPCAARARKDGLARQATPAVREQLQAKPQGRPPTSPSRLDARRGASPRAATTAATRRTCCRASRACNARRLTASGEPPTRAPTFLCPGRPCPAELHWCRRVPQESCGAT